MFFLRIWFNENYKLPSIRTGVGGVDECVHISIVLVAIVRAVDVSVLVQGTNANKN